MHTKNPKGAGRHYLRCRSRRDALFHKGDLADPAWDMLIALYLADDEAAHRSIISLCDASRLPQSTALRWVNRLCDAKLVYREPDPTDRRRVYLRPTAEGKNKAAAWLAMLHGGG